MKWISLVVAALLLPYVTAIDQTNEQDYALVVKNTFVNGHVYWEGTNEFAQGVDVSITCSGFTYHTTTNSVGMYYAYYHALCPVGATVMVCADTCGTDVVDPMVGPLGERYNVAYVNVFQHRPPEKLALLE